MNHEGSSPTAKAVRYSQKSPSPVATGNGHSPCVYPHTASRSSSNVLSPSPAKQPSPYDVGYRSPFTGVEFCCPSAYSGSLRSFAPVHELVPPPPMTHPRRANIFDEDANLEATFSPTQNPNRAVAASLSPDTERRYPPLGFYRPVSATQPMAVSGRGQRQSSQESQRLHRAASSVVPGCHLKPEKVPLTDRCGVVVCDRDPVSGAVLGQYRCGAHLGKGGFGDVFEFTDLATRAVYACKVIERSRLTSETESRVLQEVSIHRGMNHPNVVRLVKSFHDDHYFFILMERCATKNLMDLSNARGAFEIGEIQHVMRQLCSAVDYLHKRGVIHRDIKLGNIMLDFEGNVKLGDFGFAGLLGPTDRKSRICGTPNYMAPEILLSRETGEGYGFAADMWSLGVVLFILACGYPPFESTGVSATYERIKRVDYVFPATTPSADHRLSLCKPVIAGLLQRDPRHRLTMDRLMSSPLLRSRDAPSGVPQALALAVEDRHRSGSHSSGGRQTECRMVSPITECGSPYAWDPRVDTPLSQPRRAGYGGAAGSCRQVSPPYALPTGSAPGTPAAGEWGRGDSHFRHTGAAMPPVRRMKPPVPEALVRNSVYFSKYGHGFLLSFNGRDMPVVLLNDRTKLVYDYGQDVAVYYTRSQRVQADGAETYCDCPLVFEKASDILRRTSRTSDGTDDAVLSAASKKYAITLFLLPFLCQPSVDVQIPCMTSALPLALTEPGKVQGLFDDRASSAHNGTHRAAVFVKQVHLCDLQGLSDRYSDAQLQFMATRLSNDSYQVSVNCAVSCSANLVPAPENCAIECSRPWKMDLLLYGAGHAVIGVETEHMRFQMSFFDFGRSYQVGACGTRVFTSCGQTSSSTRITLPTDLLAALAAILRKVHCPGEAVSALF